MFSSCSHAQQTHTHTQTDTLPRIEYSCNAVEWVFFRVSEASLDGCSQVSLHCFDAMVLVCFFSQKPWSAGITSDAKACQVNSSIGARPDTVFSRKSTGELSDCSSYTKTLIFAQWEQYCNTWYSLHVLLESFYMVELQLNVFQAGVSWGRMFKMSDYFMSDCHATATLLCAKRPSLTASWRVWATHGRLGSPASLMAFILYRVFGIVTEHNVNRTFWNAPTSVAYHQAHLLWLGQCANPETALLVERLLCRVKFSSIYCAVKLMRDIGLTLLVQISVVKLKAEMSCNRQLMCFFHKMMQLW